MAILCRLRMVAARASTAWPSAPVERISFPMIAKGAQSVNAHESPVMAMIAVPADGPVTKFELSIKLAKSTCAPVHSLVTSRSPILVPRERYLSYRLVNQGRRAFERSDTMANMKLAQVPKRVPSSSTLKLVPEGFWTFSTLSV